MMKHLGEDSKRENCCYHDLAPVDSIDSEEESIQALRWAIKNPKVHNIALSGPYGSGKSSVIQSYLRQYDVSKRYKRLERCSLLKKLRILNLVSKSSGENLRISLATFDGNLLEKEDAKDELQKGILKQLFYKVDASKIPLSRYRKLHHIKGYRYVLAIVLSLLLIVAGGYLIFPQNVLSFWNQYWDGVNGAEKAFRIVTAIVFLVGISYLLWMFTSRFRIKSISVGDITAEGKNITEESILDRNMDEILYFFEKTKYRVVFIEDLDRFNNTEIFVNLRELNEILNNYEVIKKCGKVRINYKVCSYYSREGSTDWIVEPECISEKMKELFERYDLYKKYEIYSMDEIKAKLVQTEENLQRVRSMSIQQMLEDKDDREQLPENVKNNILLMFLLQRGYINENYADYINYFREGSISRSELNFIRTVRSRQGICDFEFVIRHHANVIEKLFDYEFEQVELLNYSLMDYMLQHCADSSQMQKLLGQVTNRTVKSKQFIKDYLSRGKFVAEFVKRIAAISMYIWEDIAEDIELTQDRQLSYLNDLLSYAYIEDLKKNDYEIDYEENGPNEPVQRSITRYICEVPDIFKRMSDVPTEKWIQIISALDVIFVRVTLQKIDKKIVNAIIKKHAFELNHHMIEEIFKITKPEYLPVLFKKNYYCIRKLSNREIVEYVDERMIDYVENIILGEQTNTEEDKDAVEIILKSLLDNKINDKDPGMYSLCGEVLKKEHLAYWETFEDFLGNYEEDTIELWEYLLRYGRITASWENCIAYYEATGEIDDALCDFIDAKIDDILIDQRNHEKVRGEKFEPPHEFFKALITSDILEDTFYKLITTFEIITFDCKCDEFSENRLRMMIQMSYIPFDLEKLNELKNISLELWMIYVANNKSDFLDNLSQERLEIEDIKNLLKADIFEADESKLVLEEIDATEIDKELAEILVSFSEKTIFEKSYVEAVWENLPEDRRYEWLYNQMEVYDLDELAEHFAQLEKTYLQFVDRDRRHKYKVYNTEYNAKLCAKLKEIGFVTGVKNTGEWLEGYVKKRG